MAADGSISFSLDLDGADFARGIADAREKVEHLIEVTKEVGIAAGVVGAAFLAVKTSIDMAVEAEQIKAINDQFERLTENAGIATDSLKEGLEKASAGLISNTDLLKAANRSIIEMGHNAEQLPQLMELARKATAAFGGNLLQNFEAINQAVATGSTRQLRHLGIIVDHDKAMRAFANSIGVTVGSLSEAEQKHAILNAVIEKGHTAFNGINPEVYKAGDAWQRLKVSVGEAAEAITSVIGGATQGRVATFATMLSNTATDFKNWFVSKFGDGAKQAAASTELLKSNIASLETQLDALNSGRRGLNGFEKEQEIKRLTATLTDYRGKLELVEEAERKRESLKGSQAAPEAKRTTEEDPEKRAAAEARFNTELLALTAARIQAEVNANDEIAEADSLFEEKRVLIADQSAAKITELKAQRRLGQIANDEQLNQLVDQIERTRDANLQAAELERDQMRLKALDNYQKASISTADGVARAFEAGARRAEIAQRDFGAVGQRVFHSFEGNAVSALQAWGAGTKSAGEAAKGFIFGMLADEAEARGKLMLLASIWPPNPAGMAAGAGLIALSGFLRSQAGGGGAATGGGADAGGGGVATTGIGAGLDNRPSVQENQQTKAVTIQVQGHYFETEATKTRLVEMVREASDATDFKITSLG